MMKLAQIISSLFQAASRKRLGDRIAFSDRVYMHLSDAKITLMSLGIGNVQAIEISNNDAKEIFRSIKRACDFNEVEEIKRDEWSWKIDSRVGMLGQGVVVINFRGPMGTTTEVVKREAVTAAVLEFARKFGLNESSPR
jgi:hypothetical protein